MTKGNIALAISALETLLGDRLSTGESIREIHGRDEAYSTPALPDAVAFPESSALLMVVSSDNPLIRCAAQSAEILSHGIPQTFSV